MENVNTDTTGATETKVNNKEILQTVMIEVQAVPRVNDYRRGRPQSHPSVFLDMSRATGAINTVGEKQVRLRAFELLRQELGIDQKITIVERRDRNCEKLGTWKINDGTLAHDYAVTVRAL